MTEETLCCDVVRGWIESMRLPRVRFTVPRLMIAVAVVAVALSVEAAITAMASLVLFRAVRRPRPVHLTTTVVLTLVAGTLLWANLRPTVWEEDFGGDVPA